MSTQIRIGLADRGRTEMDAAGRRELSRILDLVQPTFAAELRSSRDHQGRPRYGSGGYFAREDDFESKTVAFTPEALGLAAEPGLDPPLAAVRATTRAHR